MSNKPVKRKNRPRNQSQSAMPSKTREFLQKICYKKTASVDMTLYGFVKDSSLLLKPLLSEGEKDCDSKTQKPHKARLKTTNKTKNNKELKEVFTVPGKGTPQNAK